MLWSLQVYLTHTHTHVYVYICTYVCVYIHIYIYSLYFFIGKISKTNKISSDSWLQPLCT
jgi:dolichyl-phosphate-mannose--protein O-mannosyl transferase